MNIALATVHSSWGDFSIDAHTGEVIEYHPFDADNPEASIYTQVTRFDLEEYRGYYPNEPHPTTDYDILDLGYWYGRANKYEPPVDPWRTECAYERANCLAITVPPSVAELINPTTEN